MSRLHASILTVGTEITSGEILNSNGKWLAERLESLGIEVLVHLAVPDDRPLIFEALEFCGQRSEVLIVTGGLGPTSDDFTREVISEWGKDSLVFSDRAWRDLERIYKERNLNLKPAHRQQCHFPSRSRLLPNTVGTAHGFYLMAKGRHLLVLPGPPREIEGMWSPSIEPCLKELHPEAPSILHRWVCAQVPESEVAEVVEKIIAGTGLKVGYRASRPYVHVKLWVPRDQDHSALLKALETALSPWLQDETQTPSGG
jgi:molybdenum cofactor synthesis domain-containing protein